MARGKQWEPTKQDRMLVQIARAGGMEQKAVARALGVSENTLKKHCAEELQSGKDAIDAKIMGALARAAVGGNVTAQIFYLKTRCGWKDVQTVDAVIKLPSIGVDIIGPADTGEPEDNPLPVGPSSD